MANKKSKHKNYYQGGFEAHPMKHCSMFVPIQHPTPYQEASPMPLPYVQPCQKGKSMPKNQVKPTAMICYCYPMPKASTPMPIPYHSQAQLGCPGNMHQMCSQCQHQHHCHNMAQSPCMMPRENNTRNDDYSDDYYEEYDEYDFDDFDSMMDFDEDMEYDLDYDYEYDEELDEE